MWLKIDTANTKHIEKPGEDIDSVVNSLPRALRDQIEITAKIGSRTLSLLERIPATSNDSPLHLIFEFGKATTTYYYAIQ